ncbi:MAG: hypothetical protein JRH20_23130, partial [Deltaproteobacteria bacterium]|nr:hypothetical protein [Deltaproteobacteria bacterium]
LGQVVKLPMLREGLSPNGATTLAERRPTFSWDAVAGAAFYEVLLFESTGGWSNGSDAGSTVPTPSYTPVANLPDDSCFSSLIIAADASWLDGDPEAVSVSAPSYFCVDVDGQDSVTITGAVDNRSNVNARMGVFVSTDDDGEASVWIPVGQSSYQLGVLRSSGAEVLAFVDAAANGRFDSPGNQGRRGTLDLDTLQADVSAADLRINPALECIAPDFWSIEASPVLTWKDYVTTAVPNAPTTGGTLLLMLGDVNDDLREVPLGMWLLAGDRTTLDLSQPPTPADSYDYWSSLTCANAGGTPGVDASGNPTCDGAELFLSTTALQSGRGYYWALQVIDCDFAPWNDPNVGDFFTCLTTSMDGFASSELRTFISP